MDSVTHNVRDIDSTGREVLEGLVGQPLRDDQQVMINVVSSRGESSSDSCDSKLADVPSWWNIYEGLSDEEVDRLDQAIRQRANLARGGI